MVRVDVFAYSEEKILEESQVTLGRARELLDDYTVTWINIVDADERTLQELETLFGLHPVALEDASENDAAPKVEIYDHVLYIVTRTILWGAELDTDQLSLFLSKHFLITMHDREFPQLDTVRKMIRMKDPRLLKGAPGFLAYLVLDVIVDSYTPVLEKIEGMIEKLEDEIIRNPAGAPIGRVHSLRTDLLQIRRRLRPQRESFSQLLRVELPFFRKETRNYLRDVYDQMLTSLDILDTQRETVTSLMELQATLMGSSANAAMKALTAVATIMLPLTLIAGVFGMNVAFFGAENSQLGFFIALAAMAVTAGLTVLWIRRKGWL